MKEKLNVGIIGYGIVGKRRRVFIDRHPLLQTVAVADVRFNRDASMVENNTVSSDYREVEKRSVEEPITGSLKDGLPFYNSYQELLNRQDLDIIFVCVPNYLAPQATIEGLERGLHVFCEKPPGRTVDDIIRVREVEQRHPGLKLKYGFNHRYHGSVKQAKQLCDEKTLGDLLYLRGVYGKSSVVPFSGEWRSVRKYAGGGILLDQGIHMLDMFRYFCGDFHEVKSFISNKFWDHNVEDNAFAIMRDKLGRIGMIHSSATQWQHSFRLEMTLEKGSLELSGILSGSKSYGQEKLIITDRQEESVVGSLSSQELIYLEDTSWNDEIMEFAGLILEDKPVVTGSSLDALNVMKLVNSIYCADDEWKNTWGLTIKD